MKLFPHQQYALDITNDKNRVAYFYDMGLGKTFIGSEKLKQLNEKINLVVCQKSKVNDWVEHFCEHYSDYVIYDLTVKNTIEYFMKDDAKRIGVINYDIIFRRPELIKLKQFTLMLDESSMIKNESSKRTKFIVNKLKPENVILLSGSPTGGKYEELYSQVNLLGWNISKSAYWNDYICYYINSNFGFPFKIVTGYKNVKRLKENLNKYGAVFMKSEEVLTLPEQTHINIYSKSNKYYKKFEKDLVVEKDSKEYVGDTTLTQLLYLRMLCDKTQQFKDLIESTNDRLIVFYNFNEELNQLVKLIGDKPYSIVNGQVKDLNAYNNNDNSVTFIQYQSGAMGLNLQKSNKIIYYSPPLASDLFEQSKKRIHRLGQKNKCFYYYLIQKNSIEEKIYKTLEKRNDFTNRLFKKEM